MFSAAYPEGVRGSFFVPGVSWLLRGALTVGVTSTPGGQGVVLLADFSAAVQPAW